MELYEDDAAFVRALTAHSPEAAEALLKGYGGLFKSIARRYAPALDWDDIAADTVLAVWENIGQYDARAGSLKSWLAAVARYRAIDAVRRAGREVPDNGEDVGALGRTLTNDEYFRTELEDMFRGLPPADRALLLRRYFLGYTPRELACSMRVSENAVNTRVSRAKKRLAALRQEGDAP